MTSETGRRALIAMQLARGETFPVTQPEKEHSPTTTAKPWRKNSRQEIITIAIYDWLLYKINYWNIG